MSETQSEVFAKSGRHRAKVDGHGKKITLEDILEDCPL